MQPPAFTALVHPAPPRSYAADTTLNQMRFLDFIIDVSGSLMDPLMDLSLPEEMLQKLPLLAEQLRSTARSKPVMLPCSVWAVVSVLVLLKGGVRAREWFGGINASSTA